MKWFFAITIVLLQINLLICGGEQLNETCSFVNLAENDIGGFNYSQVECSQNAVCKKTLEITYINMPPYYFLNDTTQLMGFYDMLKKCCGPCIRLNEHVLQSMEELTAAAISTADFVYPILADSSTKQLYGFYYVPYCKAPHIMYVTKKGEDLLNDIFGVYPVIIVCLLMALVSGFVAWILDTWSNEEEFPRPFFIGWYEGIWWSFVSMTTVGYGDKTPKSFPARVFSVIWIIIGIVAFGILTGQITSEIVTANSPPPASMDGKKVGALHYREYDTFVISHYGGTVIRNEDVTDFYSDFTELISKLQKGEIDGFAVDKLTLAFVTIFSGGAIPSEQMNFFMTKTTRTEKVFESESLTYGILIKHTEDYQFFKDYVRDCVLRNQIFLTEWWITVRNGKWQGKSVGGNFYSKGSLLFDPSGSYFQNTVIGIVIILAFILLFGLFYELRRKSCLCWN